MKYHVPSNQFTVSPDDLQRASHALLWAVRHIRLGGKRDLKGYVRQGGMDDAEFAETGILNAAAYLGIDLGADRAGKLDVSEPK